MASFNIVRGLIERIYKCIKGSSKAEYREFTSTCIALARLIDNAVAKNQKFPAVTELPQLLKKVCEQKDNEMFQPAIMVLLLSVKNAIPFCWFSAVEEQDLWRMLKELVVFFTGTGGWNPVDTVQATQVISTVMPRFYPMLTLQDVIVALETKPGYEAMVCDFYVTKKPSASEEVRMFVIRKENLDTSACLVTPNHVNFLVNGKGVEKRSLTSMDAGPQMPSNVTSMLKIGTNLLQIVGDFPGHCLIAIAFTTSKASYSSPSELQNFSYDGVTAQIDEELIEGPSRVSLLCPISHKRISSPVKGASCKHHQCFDYFSFMEINSRRPSWRCPYCNRNVSFPDLRLDRQMLKILKDCQGNAVDVMVSEDGSWELLKNEDTSGANRGTMQNTKRKDGILPNSPGDSSSEEGEIRFEKQNLNYIELSDTEDQDRQDHESTRQSLSVVNLGPGGGGIGGDEVMEDIKPDVRDINVTASTLGQALHVETVPGSLLSSTSVGEPSALIMNSQSMNFTMQGLANDFNISEGLPERQINAEVSRPPIAIQALPVQTGTTNAGLRVRARSSSQPNSPAHTSGSVHPITSSSQLGVNQRPLQVQLPSFVGILDGQVLLHTGQLQQQLQVDAPENVMPVQNADSRDYRQRVIQQLQQQRTVVSQPFVTQPATQPVTRLSREHSFYTAARNPTQIRGADRQSGQQQASLQRPDSPNLLDSQRWQQARQQQQPIQQQLQLPLQQQPIQQQLQLPLQQQQQQLQLPVQQQLQLQGHASSTNSIASVAEGIPMFNQSAGASSALRRQTSQNARTVAPQYLQSMTNPLIVPNTNIPLRDQRWVSSLESVPALHVDTSTVHLAEQIQRRMRGSISSPSGRDAALTVSNGLASTSMPWMYGAGSSQPSRFSPGVSLSAWNNDALRQPTYTAVGTTLQSVQTASTLVSDFDNWFDMQMDPSLAQHGMGDL